MTIVTVDDLEQAQWLEQIRGAHSAVTLYAVEPCGHRHRVIDICSSGIWSSRFEGEAERMALELPGIGLTTSWSTKICPTAGVHLRADSKGQIEAWSGTVCIAKIFSEQATPDDWPPQLIHACASRVRHIYKLLRCTFAATVRSIDLARSTAILDLGPIADLGCLTELDLSECRFTAIPELAYLTELATLDLSGCTLLSDESLRTLRGLTSLNSLRLSSLKTLTDLKPLGALVKLSRLDLGGCERLRDLTPLRELRALSHLCLSRCVSVSGLEPLAGLSRLTSLELGGCGGLSDLQPLSGLSQLNSLDLSGHASVHDLEPLASLKQLKSLNLSGSINLKQLGPLAGLGQLTCLLLDRCKGLHDLGPLSRLCELTTLDLGHCANLGDLSPLAGLIKLSTLRINADNVVDVGPLAGLVHLTSLDLSGCFRLRSVSPLRTLTNLRSIKLCECPDLGLISGIDELPLLETVWLYESPNVRDVDALSKLPSLRELKSGETAAQDSVLLACATRRGDDDLQRRLETSAASLHLSRSPGLHAQRLVEGVKVLAGRPGGHSDVLRNVASAMRARPEIGLTSWQALFAALARAPDPTLRPAFEVALAELPLADVERVLAPALLALAEVPATAKAWALDLAQRALLPVAASATHAREVAPAAAVFFHSQGLVTEVDAWLERGSAAQAPAWRDRVLVALLGRALRTGEVLEARRLFALVQTPERRDEARGLLVQHLSSRAEFRDAAAELDAIVDRAVRASVAASALRQAPAWSAEPHAGLSLLLALDGDPDTLAEVLSSMIQQAPDSELVRHLAAVFAPTQGADLAKQLDAILAHASVAEHAIPKRLSALRGRIGADTKLVNRALVHGAVALLEADGVIDNEGRAQITSAILGQPT